MPSKSFLAGFGAILFTLPLAGCASFNMARMQIEAKETYKSLSDSPLRPYLLCGAGDGLEVVALHGRGNPGETTRLVQSGSKVDTISVIEGYRVMFAYPDAGYFFANVKVEASHPAQYASDKVKLKGVLDYLAEMDSGVVLREKEIRRSSEIHGLYGPFDQGGTLAIDNLFLDKEKVVVSIYYLNQGKKNRRFKDIAEFQKIREGFLERWTTCAEKADSDAANSLRPAMDL